MGAWFGRIGSSDALPEKMPAVWLVTDPSFSESRARFVADGCEEEGIPLAWDVKQGNADELARFASLRSQLEVGIGLDANGGAIALVAVTDKPYITRGADSSKRLRWLGQAAARISKSQPIPDEGGEKQAPAKPSIPTKAELSAEDEIAEIVRMATAALLKEMQEGGGERT
ncbi:MAG: glycerol dehydratase reactivase beta/small subunit family protein [Synergistaceae bacterium]|jgi:hypothetical protein|nr:glycerol dehydratase reactivase beta/small subunit family protein [Synergistaceae bacterium]